MKLAKALKLKNKLAGKVAQLQKQIASCNVVEGENKPAFAALELYTQLQEAQNELISLKSKIAAGNIGISDKIVRMAELKARITFLRGLPTRDGKFNLEGRYGATLAVAVEYRSQLSPAFIEGEVQKLSDEIDGLQDAVDQYNVTTEI